jgi:putative spermidine/putrescine transport system ATP-binding protein
VAVEATVREIVYAGSATRVVADAAHGLTLTAVLLNSAVGPVDLHRDDTITLSWDRAAVRVLGD